jgi:hypothetical protein
MRQIPPGQYKDRFETALNKYFLVSTSLLCRDVFAGGHC